MIASHAEKKWIQPRMRGLLSAWAALLASCSTGLPGVMVSDSRFELFESADVLVWLLMSPVPLSCRSGIGSGCSSPTLIGNGHGVVSAARDIARIAEGNLVRLTVG
jgi:hypothetical protein